MTRHALLIIAARLDANSYDVQPASTLKTTPGFDSSTIDSIAAVLSPESPIPSRGSARTWPGWMDPAFTSGYPLKQTRSVAAVSQFHAPQDPKGASPQRPWHGASGGVDPVLNLNSGTVFFRAGQGVGVCGERTIGDGRLRDITSISLINDCLINVGDRRELCRQTLSWLGILK